MFLHDVYMKCTCVLYVFLHVFAHAVYLYMMFFMFLFCKNTNGEMLSTSLNVRITGIKKTTVKAWLQEVLPIRNLPVGFSRF